jgi:hypothetical protein
LSEPTEADVWRYIEIHDLDVGDDFRAFMKAAHVGMSRLSMLKDIYKESTYDG